MKDKHRKVIVFLSVICTILAASVSFVTTCMDTNNSANLHENAAAMSVDESIISPIQTDDSKRVFRILDSFVIKNNDASTDFTGRYSTKYEAGFSGKITLYNNYHGEIKVPVTVDDHTSIFRGTIEYKDGYMYFKLISTEDFQSSSKDPLIISINDPITFSIFTFDEYDLNKGFSSDVDAILLDTKLNIFGFKLNAKSKMKYNFVYDGDVVVSTKFKLNDSSVGSSFHVGFADNDIEFVIDKTRGFNTVDNNNDGKLNAADASNILEYSAAYGAGDLKDFDFDTGKLDLNADGCSDARDAADMLTIAAALGSGSADYEDIDAYMARRN